MDINNKNACDDSSLMTKSNRAFNANNIKVIGPEDEFRKPTKSPPKLNNNNNNHNNNDYNYRTNNCMNLWTPPRKLHDHCNNHEPINDRTFNVLNSAKDMSAPCVSRTNSAVFSANNGGPMVYQSVANNNNFNNNSMYRLCNTSLPPPLPPPPLPPPPSPLLSLTTNTTTTTTVASHHQRPPIPYRKHSVFVAPSDLSSIIPPVNTPLPLPPPPASRSVSPPDILLAKKLPPQQSKDNAQILQHITKIISENAAIVETLDPLWSKRYMSRHSTCVPPVSVAYAIRGELLNGMTSPSTGSSVSLSGSSSSVTMRRYSESNGSTTMSNCNQSISKLQSALLGKPLITVTTNATIPEIPLEHNRVHQHNHDGNGSCGGESSQQSVIINTKDCASGAGTSYQKGQSVITDSIVRNLLTAKAPPIQIPPIDKCKSLPAGPLIHPQNPEGSIIKDLLLKSRDDSQKKLSRGDMSASVPIPGGSGGSINSVCVTGPAPLPPLEQESSMLVYVCTVCKIAFRNKENLEVHQEHYCKGLTDDLLSEGNYNSTKMNELVQRKVSVMARPNILQRHLQHGGINRKHGQSESSATIPPVGNILKQQLLAPHQGPVMKKRKISEPVFRSSGNCCDIQIIDEINSQLSRRVSVVQQNKSLIPASTIITSPPTGYTSLPPTVIQSVLHSGATVIEKNDNAIPLLKDNNNNSNEHKPVSECADEHNHNLVINKKKFLEIIPAYMPHLSPPNTKITIKGPPLFPVLKNWTSNRTDLEFIVEDNYSAERKTSTPLKQVPSIPPDDDEEMPEENKKEDNVNIDNKIINDNCNGELTETTSASTSTSNNTLIPLKSMAIRPRTLTLKMMRPSSLIGSTLISPDTPRPKQNCVQLYMNGHAYTLSRLKISTRSTYCSIYRVQPMFITQEANPGLSMYCNWQTSPLPSDDILNLASPSIIMSMYDTVRGRKCSTMLSTMAGKCDLNATHSSYWQFRNSDHENKKLRDTIMQLREELGECDGVNKRKTSEESAFSGDGTDSDGGIQCGDNGPPKRVRIFEGGFKSNEDYTYVRGRGRGKYVCEECGIRCKKPSMLKKHIRTHTDLRPYSCRHCAFAFKTKGNLTKHMKSKAHHKKCVEMGINPVPIAIDDSQIDTDALAKQEMLEITCGGHFGDDDDEDDDGEYDDDDDEDDDDDGVPIPLNELERFGPRVKKNSIVSVTVPVPGQFDDADVMVSNGQALRKVSDGQILRKVSDGQISGKESDENHVNTETEEQEAARSLLILSGSGSESDLTVALNANRKVSEHRSLMVESERKNSDSLRRVSDNERPQRVSFVEPESALRRISESSVKNTEIPEIMVPITVPHHDMQQQQLSQQLPCNNLPALPPPSAPPSSLMPSPRKLSPIEHLQQQVQQQMIQPQSWTPNCDSTFSRQRSYSFNDVPLSHSNLPLANATITIGNDPIIVHADNIDNQMTDDDSNDSYDSFAARRYSTSVITDRRLNSCVQKVPSSTISVITEREEPMDLSITAKAASEITTEMLPMVASQKIPISLLSESHPFIPVLSLPRTGVHHMVLNNDTIDGKSVCSICNKTFSRPSQLRLHINIHYFERPFRCDSCAVSFRTKGHLQKHKRSVSHFNKVNMNMTFGTPTTDNPRPFKCADCKIAFRIHGHLAKHLRSKMHIMKLECLGKLPFGMYAEMERSGVNLNEIDTTDCENSLQSLQTMANRLYDPRQMRWESEHINDNTNIVNDDNDIDDGDGGDGGDDQLVTTDGTSYVTDVKVEPHDTNNFYHHHEVHNHQLLSNSETPHDNHYHSILSPIQSQPNVSQNIVAQQQQLQQSQSSGITSTRSNTCNLCGRLFKGAKFLQVHLYCDHQQSQSPATTPIPSPPPVANDSVGIIGHEMECDICHRGFNDIVLLQQHLLTHSVHRPYVCEICDAGFTSSILLSSHIPTHHPLAAQQT